MGAGTYHAARMPFARSSFPFLGVALTLVACGGSSSGAKTSTVAPSSSAAPLLDAGAPAPAASGAPSDKYAAAETAPHVDPNEKEGPIELTPLVDKAKSPVFPKPTIGDHDCLKQLPFSGHHQRDFATLVERCGTPTGMLEHTKPAEGRLHARHDKRDDFRVKLQKDMCYRYFAVADDGIKDIDIVVLKKGALLAMDTTDQPIAVIHGQKLWCVDEDMEIDVTISVDGSGAGGYTFGVWARAKP